MSDQDIENEIVAKGLTAPRITLDHVNSILAYSIVSYHLFEGTQLTVCCIVLPNGFTVTGESACASPENFDEELGQALAYKDATNKIWMLEGYLLRERLYQLELNKPKQEELNLPSIPNHYYYYTKKDKTCMYPYEVGMSMQGISVGDRITPEQGGMIAFDPMNTNDRWYIDPEYLKQHYTLNPDQDYW